MTLAAGDSAAMQPSCRLAKHYWKAHQRPKPEMVLHMQRISLLTFVLACSSMGMLSAT